MQLEVDPDITYLDADEVIESDSLQVLELGAALRAEHPDEVAFARAAFEWVRDRITHSIDAGDPRVTVTATEVLRDETGLCFAKSHLLAALLRSQGVPAGLCYQRLRDGDGYVLHGLVAACVGGDWHRLDARGNKPGVEAQFSLGPEQLAFQLDAVGEEDYPRVFPRPAEVVLAALQGAEDASSLCDGGLPDRL